MAHASSHENERMSIALDIAADTPPTPQEPETSVLRVEDRNGIVHELAAVEGWRLMEILRDYGIGMDNTCGGALACAECHVVLDAASAARVPPPREAEAVTSEVAVPRAPPAAERPPHLRGRERVPAAPRGGRRRLEDKVHQIRVAGCGGRDGLRKCDAGTPDRSERQHETQIT